MEPRGRYSRGYLPHVDCGQRAQFLTWHLADSIPLGVLERWRSELDHLEHSRRQRELHSRTEKLLDSGCGSQMLRRPQAAKIVQDSLLFGHGQQYRLHRWSVMPNHVHVLLTPAPSVKLGSILKDIKGYTSHAIGKALSVSGQIWQEDYYDRFIRDLNHFERVAAYIEWNPVKAKLCTDPSHWPFSSANLDVYERLSRRSKELGIEET